VAEPMKSFDQSGARIPERSPDHSYPRVRAENTSTATAGPLRPRSAPAGHSGAGHSCADAVLRRRHII